jgi:hypothetical protein
MTDHPPQAERLAAIEDGWLEAVRQSDLTVWEPQFSALTENEESESSLIAQLQLAQEQRSVAKAATLFALRDGSVGLRAFAFAAANSD